MKDIDQYFKAIEPDEVIHIICHWHGINPEFIFNGRKAPLVKARQQMAFFMRQYCRGADYRFSLSQYRKLRLSDIGVFLQQDHSTVTHALKSVESNMSLYRPYREEMEAIDDLIRKFRFTRKKWDFYGHS